MRAILLRLVGALAALLLVTALQAAPIGFSIKTVGLTDTEHTRDTDGYRISLGQYLNEAGQVAGYAHRYGSGGANLGESVWLYDGASTLNIGLTDAAHTRDTDGYRISSAEYLNEAGQVSGDAYRYGSGGASLGFSAWLYDGASTLNIGLTDTAHTRDTDGWRWSSGQYLNEAGQVAGFSMRYGGGGTDLGRSAWLYDGASTLNIGLTDTAHTRDTDGYRFSDPGYLNEAGQVAGYARRFGSGGTDLGRTTWLYDGASTLNIGLTDAEHTRDTDGYRNTSSGGSLNEAGQVLGWADRFGSGGAALGRSAWLYDGANTLNIGLTDAEHTRDTDGYRYSAYNSTRALNAAGQVFGYANRFGSGGTGLGLSAWLYDGANTLNIGLTDAEHTRDTDGYRYSLGLELNKAGQVAGYSNRYGSAGVNLGRSAWLYDGANTLNIGLTDAEHTRASDGYRNSSAELLNEAGQVTGHVVRYGAGAADLGQSAWLYYGNNTLNIGLTDAVHTRNADGYRYSVADHLNEAGQVAGHTHRYGDIIGVGGGTLGQTVWLYDGIQTITLDPLSERSDGLAYSTAEFLGEDGTVLGYYWLYDESDNRLGNRAFWFNTDSGLFDLGLLVDETFDDWVYLASAISMTDDGVYIMGQGLLADMPSGSMAHLLTSTATVPVPPAMYLFASALGLLGWRKRKAV